MTGVIKRQALPLAFSLTGILTLFGAFTDAAAVFLLPVLLLCIAVLRLCESTRTRKLPYLLAAASVLAFAVPAANGGGKPFFLWFLENRLAPGQTAPFMALFALSVFFFPSAVYYFTNVTFRAPVLLLLTFITPSLLYAKRAGVPPLSAALLVTGYLLLLAQYNTTGARLPRALTRTLCLFAVPVFLLSFCLSYAAASEPLLRWRNAPVPRNAGAARELFGYNARSSPSGGGSGSSEILFYVEAGEPLHLTRQVFGAYDGEGWLAVTEYPYAYGHGDWESRTAHMSFGTLFAAIRALGAKDGEFASARELAFPAERKMTASVFSRISAAYLPAPVRTYRVTGLRDGVECIRSASDEYFLTGQGRIRPNDTYSLEYYGDTLRNDPELQRWTEGFDRDTMTRLLERLTEKEIIPFGEAWSFWEEWRNAYAFSQDAGVYESAELKALAEQAVGDASGDYGKAAALERYLRSCAYDAGYSPPPGHEDIEYFLFKSKRGACGQFATAMTLMARAVGLHARYVEGFLASETDGNGRYVVRDSSAHAFTQVLIAPYGWVTFDATPGSRENSLAAKIWLALTGSGVTLFFTFLTAAAAAALLLRLLRETVIAEAVFRYRVARSGGREAVLRLFGRMLETASERFGGGAMSAGRLVEAARERCGADLEYAAACYERAAYNGEEMSGKERKAVRDAYLTFRAGLRRLRDTRQGHAFHISP
ncbi:MAG: transglutaminase-like domain-containing protein [Oscillospiraceae bacterium]|nr:transglutaminase-like domain-containing protein [Oscillospiraceae bacterium]